MARLDQILSKEDLWKSYKRNTKNMRIDELLSARDLMKVGRLLKLKKTVFVVPIKRRREKIFGIELNRELELDEVQSVIDSLWQDDATKETVSIRDIIQKHIR